MSSDNALLFAASRLPRYASWEAALRELRGLGATYVGQITRLTFDKAAGEWHLTTESRTAGNIAEVNSLLNQWDGAALELGSRLGPLKLLTWRARGALQSGIGLYESSSLFSAQVADADTRSICDAVATRIADALQVDFFCLVGDPAIVERSADETKPLLGKPPSATMEPLIFIVTMKDSSEQTAPFVAHPAWIKRRMGRYVQYVNPAFHAFEDDK